MLCLLSISGSISSGRRMFFFGDWENYFIIVSSKKQIKNLKNNIQNKKTHLRNLKKHYAESANKSFISPFRGRLKSPF